MYAAKSYFGEKQTWNFAEITFLYLVYRMRQANHDWLEKTQLTTGDVILNLNKISWKI